MPPPEPTDRVDPLTGRAVYHSPTAGGSFASPTSPPARANGGASQTPAAASSRRPAPELPPATPVAAPFAPPAFPTSSNAFSAAPPSPAKAQTKSPRQRRAKAGAAPRARRSPGELLQIGKEHCVERLQSRATHWLVAAATAVVVSATTLVVSGLPLLGSSWDFRVVAACVVVLAGAGAVARAVWSAARAAVRYSAAAVAALLIAALCVGVVSDPVVIDGRVLLATSKEGKAAQLSDEVYRDLRRVADFDTLLAASLEDARANVSAYDPAHDELIKVSAKYAKMPPEDLPDPAFGAVVESMKSATYWAAKAMQSKRALIDAESTRAQSDLATQRAAFTDNWLAAASQLRAATEALGIPYSRDLEGPHE